MVAGPGPTVPEPAGSAPERWKQMSRWERSAHPLVLRAEASRLSRAAIEALAAEIPSDQRQLDGLLQECVDGYFARAFTTTALAALHRGIPVDARHLVAGARLLEHPGFIGKLSANAAGDVVGSLLGAVVDGRLSWQKEAVSLFLAAYWSRERGPDAHRHEIVRRTRMCARVGRGLEVEVFLAAATDILGDDELSRLIARLPAGALIRAAREWTEPFLELARGPILDDLADDDAEPSLTRRRAVERIGRNEPCHCGSGRKYKRCCAEKDQERLRDSSDISGVTRAELRLHLEDHLTPARIISLRAHELARLDPRRVDPTLHPIILNRLNAFEELDALRDFFEAVGADHTSGHLWDAVDTALRAGKREAAKAFAEMAPLPEDWLGLAPGLLMSGTESFPGLDLLESEARERIDQSGVDIACDLLRSPWPCVGILVARGVAPLAEPWDRQILLEELGLARDRLALPALDPTEEMEDLWGPSQDPEPLEAVPFQAEPAREEPAEPPLDDEARRLLEDKEAELSRIRQELTDLRHGLAERSRRESEPSADASPVAEPAPVADPRVAALKARMARLRSELTQRHAERNQLRRQLELAQRRVDALEAERGAAERPPAEPGDGPEAEPLDPDVVLSFRVPVFSRRFRSSSEAVPDPVRRRAVIVASRIAAGDASAFRGSRRLERDRELYRQRVGREHRLLFRLGADQLEAIDLVPRKDLERTIRELTRG